MAAGAGQAIGLGRWPAWRAWSLALLVLVAGCVTHRPAPEPAPVQSAPAPVAPPPPAPAPPPPEPEPPKPKPVKPAKSKAAKKVENAAPRATESAPAGAHDLMLQTVPAAAPGDSVPQVAPVPAESAKPQAPIKGPAWLSRCMSKRLEGGVILCDANSLLVPPRPGVKVFVSDRTLERTLSDGGQIKYRAGLPRLYRFFVVP